MHVLKTFITAVYVTFFRKKLGNKVPILHFILKLILSIVLPLSITQGVKFLFFGLPPIFSYFFMKFLVFPIFFRVLLGTQKHFEILEIKLPIKLINSTKS